MNQSHIAVLTNKKTTTFVETKPGVVIDEAALQKLLDSRPPEPAVETETIFVRCYHGTGEWLQCNQDGSPIHVFGCAVLFDVELSSMAQVVGCGGFYTGFATGKRLVLGQPVSVPTKIVRQLGFDKFNGVFFDKKTGEKITHVDYLILEENCQHHYIAGPNGKAK